MLTLHERTSFRSPLRSHARALLSGALGAGLIAIAAAGTAGAHNAGHIILDDRCVELGSGNPGPYVPESNPNFHDEADADYGRLDLKDGRGDQYGARFAAEQGNSRVEPAECPQED